MKTITTIQHVQYQLRVWGLFQAIQELGAGFASVSVTARICDMLRTQIWASSDLHLFSHLSDNMYEPDHIRQTTEAVEKLNQNCRRAIAIKYKESLSRELINKDDMDNYWTREAENHLLGLL